MSPKLCALKRGLLKGYQNPFLVGNYDRTYEYRDLRKLGVLAKQALVDTKACFRLSSCINNIPSL